jgi:hypothetical protein
MSKTNKPKKDDAVEVITDAQLPAEADGFPMGLDPEFLAAASEAGSEQGIDDIADAGLSYITLDKDSGDFKYRQEALGEKDFHVVVLDYAVERRWFKDKFKKDVIKSPDCFAVGTDKTLKGDMKASARSTSIQFDGPCKDCPLGVFDGDCMPYLRLLAYKVTVAVNKSTNRFQANTYHSDQLVILRVAPASMKFWNNFVKQFLKRRDDKGNKFSFPTYAFIIKVSAVQSDPESTNYYWSFKAESYVDKKILEQSKLRRVEVAEAITQEYNLNSEAPKQQMSAEEQELSDEMADNLMKD